LKGRSSGEPGNVPFFVATSRVSVNDKALPLTRSLRSLSVKKSESVSTFLVPFTLGSFVYIATADLIPELKKETALKKSMLQLLFIILGVGVMGILLLLE